MGRLLTATEARHIADGEHYGISATTIEWLNDRITTEAERHHHHFVIDAKAQRIITEERGVPMKAVAEVLRDMGYRVAYDQMEDNYIVYWCQK